MRKAPDCIIKDCVHAKEDHITKSPFAKFDQVYQQTLVFHSHNPDYYTHHERIPTQHSKHPPRFSYDLWETHWPRISLPSHCPTECTRSYEQRRRLPSKTVGQSHESLLVYDPLIPWSKGAGRSPFFLRTIRYPNILWMCGSRTRDKIRQITEE